MHHGGQEILIKDALVFLFAAGIVVPLLRLGKIPAVAGFVLAGAALGPNGLGALADQWSVLSFFAVTDPGAAAPFAELGVLFLLFLLGLELSFEKLWALRRVVFGAGVLQAGLSAALIGGVAYALGLSAFASVTIGLALALSSTAVVMQVLIDERRAATPVGRTALGVLLLQDILVAPILIFVSFVARDAMGEGDAGVVSVILDALLQGVIAIGVITLIGRYALRPIFHVAAYGGGRDFLMALTLLVVVGAAVITASAGLSLALGAFLAGLLLGETEFKHQTEVDLEPFKGLLLGLFFLTVGMGFDLVGIVQDWALILGGVALLILAKGLIALVACRLFAGGWALSLETAVLLAPAGEFAFVVLAAATVGGVVDDVVAARLGAVAGLSMLTIPLLGKLGGYAARFLAEPVDGAPLVSDYSNLEGHVIVAGFGRVGRAVAHILDSEEAELVALERDPPHVARARSDGWKVYVGDAARTEILVRAGAEGAALFIVTVNDAASAEAMVRAVRQLRSDAPILARAQDAEHALALQAAGANYVIPDAVEAGLQMAGRALESFGYETETVRDRIAAARDAEYLRAAGDE